MVCECSGASAGACEDRVSSFRHAAFGAFACCCLFALRACISALSSNAQSSRWPRQALLARPAAQHGNSVLVTPPSSLNPALALCSTAAPRACAACFRSLTRAKANACSCHNGSGMLKAKLCPHVHTWGRISVDMGTLLLVCCCTCSVPHEKVTTANWSPTAIGQGLELETQHAIQHATGLEAITGRRHPSPEEEHLVPATGC